MKVQLKIGDKCPSFEALNQRGELVRSSDYLGVKGLVLFFYPKDQTSGCTKEVCSFRDAYEDFVELGYEVIGVSSDSLASHQRFASMHNLNFQILADPTKTIRKAFGTRPKLFGLLDSRVTFIIDKDGIIQNSFENLFDAERHIENAKTFLKGQN